MEQAAPKRGVPPPSTSDQSPHKRPRLDDPPPLAGPLDTSWVCILFVSFLVVFSSCTSLHLFSIGCNFFDYISVSRYWMLLLYLQEDLPYPEDLDGLGSLLGEDLPIDCATPSSSRLTHPPSSLLGSVFGRKSDAFCLSSPSVSPSVTTQGPTVVTLDDSDDQTPLFDLSKHAPIHKRAGKKLQQLIAESPAAPLPLPVQKYDAYTPMTMYYGGHLVHYQIYDSLPHLLVYHLYKPFPLPVDQDLVRVAKDGAGLIFYINIHVSELSDLFRPFIWAGSLQRPQIKKPSDPASSLAFRQFMAHEQVRCHTSLTPTSNFQKQWVENNRSLLTDMNDLMAEVQKDDQHRIPIVHVDIISSNTRVSQYLRAPIIPWNTTQRSPSDLRSLLKPAVGQSVLSGERDACSAAYLFWVIVHQVLLSSELNEIMQNMVVALKREGKQTFSSLAAGQQGALQFALKPLQNMFSRALVKAFAFKHRLRLEVLGTLRPFAIYDVLISSSLICPGLFPDSSWDEAANLLRQSMDSPSLRTWDGRAPAFNAPPPARARSFREPPPSPRPPRQSPTPWRADTSCNRNPRHTNNRGDSNNRSFRGRGGRSSRGRSSQFSHTSPPSASFRQPPAQRGRSRGRANSRRQYANRNSSRRSGSRGRAGSSSAHRGRQSGRSF